MKDQGVLATFQQIFRSRPGEWISVTELNEISITPNSSVSALRKQFGMDIRNRQRTERRNGQRVAVSEYCYFPPGTEDQP